MAAIEQRPPSSGRPGLWAMACCLPLALPAVAETPPERAEVRFKTLDYRESQPGADRVAVRAATLSLRAPVNESWAVQAGQTVDTISGASPAYHSERLTSLKDFRRAWNAGATRYFGRGSWGVSAVHSRENDYVSRAFATQGTWATEDKNTVWNAGWGVSSDTIRPIYGGFEDSKRVQEALLGVTQVLSPTDIVQFNLSHSWGQGYYTDPYKLLDERPRSRHSTRLLARWNHHVDSVGATLRTSYRYSRDSWAVRAHTLAAEWVQPVSGGWTLTPSLRAHAQTNARFYLPVDPATAPNPGFPPADALYYSADQRLSAFGALTVGLRVDKQIHRDWTVDLKWERYTQRTGWAWAGGLQDPGLLPFRATWVQVGLTHQF
ncbi:MAG: DUF3570 domain-containing protein [Burkholderiaceae bacterium]|nr:DUF3570 domain-containing protein [Burkholderiaceae bacterium]